MTIERSPAGTWGYRFWHQGRLCKKKGFADKKAAQQAEWDRRGELGPREPWQQPPAGTGPEARLADYAERWLEQLGQAVTRGDLAPRTLESYRYHLDKHILPRLGRLALRSLTFQQIEAMLTATTDSGLGRNTVRLVRATLSKLYSDAVTLGHVTSHPVIAAGRRRRAHAQLADERARPLTQAERDHFLATVLRRAPRTAAEDPVNRYDLLFELLVKTGLRPGEAFALQVGHVSADGLQLHIERAWDSVGAIVRPTKTYERRRVDVPPALAARLRPLLRGRSPETWLLPNQAGQPLELRRVRRTFRAILRAARLERVRVYDLRHTYATLRLLEGAPSVYVSGQLGHRDVTTTLRFYARWIPHEDSRRWVEDDRRVRPVRPARPVAMASP